MAVNHVSPGPISPDTLRSSFVLISPVGEKPVVAKSDLPGSAHLSSEEGGHVVSQSKQHRNENWPYLLGKHPRGSFLTPSCLRALTEEERLPRRCQTWNHRSALPALTPPPASQESQPVSLPWYDPGDITVDCYLAAAEGFVKRSGYTTGIPRRCPTD